MSKDYKSMEDEPHDQGHYNKAFSLTNNQGKAGDLVLLSYKITNAHMLWPSISIYYLP